MLFKRWMVAISLLLVLVTGFLSLLLTQHATDVLLHELEQVHIAIQSGDWADAAIQAKALLNDWHNRKPSIQIFVSHRDTDLVDLALNRLEAAIRAEDFPSTQREIADTHIALQNLPVRESPSLANVL